MDDSLQVVDIQLLHKQIMRSSTDVVIVEQPLQISLRSGAKGQRATFTFAITMRTPGHDLELTYGFLFSEHIIEKKSDVVQIRRLSEDHLLVELKYHVSPDRQSLERNILATSSCGACGKTSIEQLKLDIPWVLKPAHPMIEFSQLKAWLAELSRAQSLFQKTGGNHAVALCVGEQEHHTMEDVGRHNAMDKVIGQALMNQRIPLEEATVLVSGRASFELVQKALTAGIPIMAAVGAPSSLAVELAKEYDMTLIAFLGQDRCNIYSGNHRFLQR